MTNTKNILGSRKMSMDINWYYEMFRLVFGTKLRSALASVNGLIYID